MLLTHWLTLFERDWQLTLDVRTSRVGHTSSSLLYRGKYRKPIKHKRSSVPPIRNPALSAHWKSRRRQCSST